MNDRNSIVKSWENRHQRTSRGGGSIAQLRYPRARLGSIGGNMGAGRNLDMNSCSPIHPPRRPRTVPKLEESHFQGRWEVLHTSEHIPTARCGHTISLHGFSGDREPSHLLVACGESSLNPKREYFNDFYKLDLRSHVWSTVNLGKQNNMCSRADHSIAVFGANESKLLMFGGKCRDSYLDDLYVIHDVPTARSRLQPIVFRTNPTGRRGASLTRTRTSGRFLLFGGQRGALFFNDLWCLDLASMKWREVSMKRPPAYRAFHSAFVDWDDTLHVLGGITDVRATPVGPEIHKCDLRSGTWVRMTGKDRVLDGFDRALSKGHHTSHLVKNRSDLAIYLQRGDAYLLGGTEGTSHCAKCLKIDVEPSDQNPKTYCRVPSAMWTDNTNNQAQLYIHGGYNPNAKKCTHNVRKLTFGIEACGPQQDWSEGDSPGKANAKYLDIIVHGKRAAVAGAFEEPETRERRRAAKQGNRGVPGTPPHSSAGGHAKRKRDAITPGFEDQEGGANAKRFRAGCRDLANQFVSDRSSTEHSDEEAPAKTVDLGVLIRGVEGRDTVSPLQRRPLKLGACRQPQNATPMRVPRPSRIVSMYGTPQHRHTGAVPVPLALKPERRFKLARTPIRVPVGASNAPHINCIQRDKSNDGSNAHKKVANIDPELLDDDEADTSMHEDASLAWRTINDIIINPSENILEAANPFILDSAEVTSLIDEAKDIFRGEPSLVRFDHPVKIFGDIHGQLGDLLALFRSYGQPDHVMGDITSTKYLFMGDFVDRGHKSLEVMCLLIALKIRYPDRVFLIRGNHECKAMNELYGFQDEMHSRLPDDRDHTMMDKFEEMFDLLPLAAVISKRILCVHGGVGHIESLEQIANVKRPCRLICDPDLIETMTDRIVVDLMWSDPADDDKQKGFKPNSRGVSCVFGADIVRKFCKNNGLDLIVRAHQVVKDGYEYFAGGHLITLFSATNYCGQMDNSGAILYVDTNFRVTPKLVDPNDGGSHWRRIAGHPASPMRASRPPAEGSSDDDYEEAESGHY